MTARMNDAKKTNHGISHFARSGSDWAQKLGLKVCPNSWVLLIVFFFSSRRRHTRFDCDWSSDVCSSDLAKHGDIKAEIRNHGGEFNGSTSFDRTNYFEVLPATDENLKWGIEMEADRFVKDRKSVV